MQREGNHPLCTNDEGMRKIGETPCMRQGAAPLSSSDNRDATPVATMATHESCSSVTDELNLTAEEL